MPLFVFCFDDDDNDDDYCYCPRRRAGVRCVISLTTLSLPLQANGLQE